MFSRRAVVFALGRLSTPVGERHQRRRRWRWQDKWQHSGELRWTRNGGRVGLRVVGATGVSPCLDLDPNLSCLIVKRAGSRDAVMADRRVKEALPRPSACACGPVLRSAPLSTEDREAALLDEQLRPDNRVRADQVRVRSGWMDG